MGRRKRNNSIAAAGEKKARLKRAAAKLKRLTAKKTAGQKLHAKMHNHNA